MTDTEKSKEEKPWLFNDVGQWVEEFLLPMYRRPLDDAALFRWDPQWWRYPEVCMRLEALWGTWEKMRYEGAPGLAVWFRDYLDPMMREILSPVGPFHAYKPHEDDGTERALPAQMPSAPIPEGLFRLPDQN